jgi:hypothetical protein
MGSRIKNKAPSVSLLGAFPEKAEQRRQLYPALSGPDVLPALFFMESGVAMVTSCRKDRAYF